MGGDPASFGERVRRLRLGAGLSQAELAEAAGISERTVSDIERGLRATVYAATARRLADSLGIAEHEQRRSFLTAAAGRRRQPAPGDDGVPVFESRHRARLPAPITRLIGREQEVAALGAVLREGTTRLLTIVGPGGVGKTRFAVETARRWSDDAERAVYYVDLSAVGDAASTLPAVATSIGIPVVAGDLVANLSDVLGASRSLLLLDTMEHLLDAAPDVADLVGQCPALTVLVTSRSPLRVRGERQWPLEPLTVRGQSGVADPESPAVELFLERARAVAPAFPDDADTRAAVAAICSRLDGLPLALELAAARVRTLSIVSLLSTLDDRLSALTGGARDAPSRHRTMRAALEWSLALLDESTRTALRALSVFHGGTTAEALSAVLSGVGSDIDARAALDALADASLVVVDVVAVEARIRLLDLVLAYAHELATAAGERDALEQAHARYFLSIAQRAEPHLRGDEQDEWLLRLHADEPNLRAAMTWSIDHLATDTALQLASALWMFWRRAGLFVDARRWLDAALDMADPRSPARLPVLWGAGWLAFHQGDYPRTAAIGAEMLGLSRRAEDVLQHRNALTLIGNAALALDDDTGAIASLRAALDLCDSSTGEWVRAASMLNLATAMSAAGHPDDAIPLCERAEALFTSVGDRNFAARAGLQRGYAELRRGQDGAAARHIGSAMQAIEGFEDLWTVAEGLEAVAALWSDERPEDAAALAGAAAHVRSRIAMLPHPGDARINDARARRTGALLGEDAFSEAWRRGVDAPLRSMVEMAVRITTHRRT